MTDSSVLTGVHRLEVVRTACNLCQNFCGILVHKQDDVIIKIEGDPDNPRNRGHACAKGLSGHLSLFSQHRVTSPMIRTNPDKGPNADPRWREVGWEEAIDIFAEKIAKIRNDPAGYDGKRIVVSTFDHWATYFGVQSAWCRALGVTKGALSAACFCGNAVHPPSILNTATFEITPDAEYTKYLLLIGAQVGSIIHYDTMSVARQIAEKRPGEIKVVAVDPVCGYAASKAEEWIPIRPGTDGAFILAIINLLINEYGFFDADFLKKKTNAPYLIGDDGLYVRESGNGKPMVWDTVTGAAKPFDAEVSEYALEGKYLVNDKPCSPSFQVLKDHVRKYTPDYVSEITTTPVETIRRTAKELGEAAHIGETIQVDGVDVPYRPISVVWYRGLSAHRHSYLTGLAAVLIPTLLGAIQVPGGIRGHPHAAEEVTSDGLVAIADTKVTNWRGPYPPRRVTKPSRPDVYELFPVSAYSTPMIIPALIRPERFGLPAGFRGPELLITYRDNAVKDMVSGDMVVEAFKKIPFIVAFAVEMDETTNMADLVFPDLHYLERLAESMFARIDEPGYWYGAKPVTKPPYSPPYDKLVNNAEIFLAVAEKAGFLPEVYQTLNEIWNLDDTRYQLDTSKKYSYSEIADRRLKSWLGEDKGLDWFLSDDGGLSVWKARVEERYKGPFRKGRIHSYFEFMLGAGKAVREITDELGIQWDTEDYQALPDWKPCKSYLRRSEEYDLFVINYKVPIQIHGIGVRNPLLRQLNNYHGLDFVLINPKTAAAKGVFEGDEIQIETIDGKTANVVITITERVHPEVLGTLQHRISKGSDFNSLISMDDETVDSVGCATDSCLLAKINKIDKAVA